MNLFGRRTVDGVTISRATRSALAVLINEREWMTHSWICLRLRTPLIEPSEAELDLLAAKGWLYRRRPYLFPEYRVVDAEIGKLREFL